MEWRVHPGWVCGCVGEWCINPRHLLYASCSVLCWHSRYTQVSCLSCSPAFALWLRRLWIFANHAILISALALQYVFGIKDTLTCLDMGAVETLLVWENLDCDRYEVRCWNGVIGVPHWLCGLCDYSVAAPMCGRREGDVVCKHVISVM